MEKRFACVRGRGDRYHYGEILNWDSGGAVVALEPPASTANAEERNQMVRSVRYAPLPDIVGVSIYPQSVRVFAERLNKEIKEDGEP